MGMRKRDVFGDGGDRAVAAASRIPLQLDVMRLLRWSRCRSEVIKVILTHWRFRIARGCYRDRIAGWLNRIEWPNLAATAIAVCRRQGFWQASLHAVLTS